MRPHEVDEVLAALWGHFRDQLTPWESDFVGTVQAQWDRRHHLTEPQEAKLSEVWEEFASGRRRREAG